MKLSLVAMIACLAAGCGFDVRGAGAGGDGGTDSRSDAEIDVSTPPALVDTGLIVRYFIDESSAGQAVTELIDAAPSPLNIPITYGQASYVERAGNRGLYWPSALGSGKVEISLGAPKLSTSLRIVTTTTMELVVDLDDADGTTICHVAGLRGLNPDFMLSAVGPNELRFHRPYNALTATWFGVDARDRMVLHVVYDALHPDPERRVELYKNGVLAPKTTSSPPPMGESMTLSAGSDFIIGNHQDQDRSISGTIHYVAYYDRTLTDTEIANNALRLLASDDR